MPITQGSKVRLDGRVGTVTHVAAGLADVDFGGGDWIVVPVYRLSLAEEAD